MTRRTVFIYTEMTKKALRLSFDAHKNQEDKSGAPYVYHPFHLAEQMTTEDETIVALLHDVVEDTDYSLHDIKAMGFSNDVIKALSLLTHDESVPYMDYIATIKDNPVAKTVKLADLRHNSDLARVDVVSANAIKRVQKYAEAIKMLTGSEGSTLNLCFTCCSERNIYLGGRITDGCLSLVSKAYGDDYDSEKHYDFSKGETEKLFSILTLDEFVNLCNTKKLIGMESFLERKGITYSSCTI